VSEAARAARLAAVATAMRARLGERHAAGPTSAADRRAAARARAAAVRERLLSRAPGG